MLVKLCCQHCGNIGLHTILESESEKELIEFEPGKTYEQDYEIAFCRCESCYKHSLFSFLDGNSDEAFSLYPGEKIIDQSVPELIIKAYTEALKIKKISRIAFVIMIRRALDLLCIQEGTVGNNLLEKIKNLGSKKIIPKVLSDMADTIRLLGNESAHDDNLTLEDNDLEILDDFYSSIIE